MTQKIWLGAHTSAAGGAPNALKEAARIGANTLQLFTSNQKQWKGREISEEEAETFKALRQQYKMEHLMSHDSYLINLGSCDPLLLEKSKKAFEAEIDRCHLLEIDYLNFHPGAATKDTPEACIERIKQSLIQFEKQLDQGQTRLLLETTAGQGTSIGHRFEQIAAILEPLHTKIPIGVCIDTCHSFVAGYDLRTKEDCEQTFKEFDRVIGLKHLYAFHINDSLKGLGSRVDRHAPIGQGMIGLEAFRYLMTSPKTRHIPKYLETPDGPEAWKTEISLLKEFALAL